MTKSKFSQFDIASIKKPDETADMTLLNPYEEVPTPLMLDDDTPMTITVYGHDSAHYRQAQRDIKNKALADAQKKKKVDATTIEKIEESALNLVSKCIKSWNIRLGDEQPDCTPENIVKIFTEYPWMKDQVDIFMHDRANFLKG